MTRRLTVWRRADGGCSWFCNRCGWKGSSTVCGRCGEAWASCRCERRKPEPAREPDRERQLTRALALWRSSMAITADDPAGRYLRGRGCRLPHPDGDLRWHPRVEHHGERHRGPALVAKVTDFVELDATTLKPAFVTLHQTWVALDGSGKAKLERPRSWWYGLPKRGICRLVPDAEVTLGLALGEGLETCLAFARGFASTWSALDAGNLAKVPVLPGIEAMTIIADHDRVNPQTGKRPGVEAAIDCGRRWLAAGIEVRVAVPGQEGADMADIAQGILRAIEAERLP